jgi:hypothetical protein
MKRIMFLLVTVLMVSCEKAYVDLAALGENSGIVGTWIEDGYRGDTLLLNRSGKLESDRYGFTIQEDGSFTEHKNAGWCGTPPITYDDFDGTWEAVSDSLLDITVAYWGGVMTYQIRIVSVDGRKLTIRYLYSVDRAEANRFNF